MSAGRRILRGGAYHWEEYGIEGFLPEIESRPRPRTLLLGCGDAGERATLEGRGLETLGLDIRRTHGVDVAADAHHLPLRDETFDLVLSLQVLEHLHTPWIAIREVARVLRPGGWFVGSVAFLKPYHGSYFHMTHAGVESLARSAGLVADRFVGAQGITYSVYGGLLPLGGRRLRHALFDTLDRMVARLRVLAWSLTRRADPDEPVDRFQKDRLFSFREFDRLRFAPTVVFRARKPAAHLTIEGSPT